MPPAEPHKADNPGTVADAQAGATLDAALQSAQAGDPTAVRALEQFNHWVHLEAGMLVNVNTIKPDQKGVEALAALWAWTETMMLEDQRMIYSFKHINVAPELVRQLMGDRVWKAIFGEADVQFTTALPVQLRQLVAYQLRQLSSSLQAQNLEEIRRKAEADALSQRDSIAKQTDEMRKAAGKRTRCTDAQPY